VMDVGSNARCHYLAAEFPYRMGVSKTTYNIAICRCKPSSKSSEIQKIRRYAGTHNAYNRKHGGAIFMETRQSDALIFDASPSCSS
jgi:hypothetical protein